MTDNGPTALAAREDICGVSLSAHELCDKAVNLVALQGRAGCRFGDVWRWLGIESEPKICTAVGAMLSRRSGSVIVSEDVQGERRVVAEECERLRSLGVGRREVVADAMEYDILEEIGRRGAEGCEMASVQSELRRKRKGEEQAENKSGKKRRNLASQHSEPLAVDRLVQQGLVSKVLRTRTVKAGNRSTRVTANVLRLCRFGLSGTEAENGASEEPWKRALLTSLVTAMRSSEPKLSIVRMPTTAAALEHKWPFAELWKGMKEAGTLARIAALIDGPTPAIATIKVSSASELCRKVCLALGAHLEFFQADVLRAESKRADGREMWCVGIRSGCGNTTAQKSTRDCDRGLSRGLQWLGSTGFLRGIYDRIRSSGARGGRTNVLTRDFDHATSKLVEKGVAALVRADAIQLRRVTEGRAHSYLALTPEACAVYTKWEKASTAAASKKDVVDVVDFVKPERSIINLDLAKKCATSLKPPEQRQHAPAPVHAPGQSIDSGDARDAMKALPRCLKEEGGQVSSFVPGRPIQLAHTAERKRRAALILSTVSKHRVVDKGALLLALYRLNDQAADKPHRVDAKTWKRLIQQLVEAGELGEARVDLPNEVTGGEDEPPEPVVVVHAADVVAPSGPEIEIFVSRRVAKMRDEERQAAEQEAERQRRAALKRQRHSSQPQSTLSKRICRVAAWGDERRREARNRYGRVSAGARKDLATFLNRVALEAAEKLAARRSASRAASQMTRRPRRKRTATRTTNRPSVNGSLKPQRKAPPQVVGGHAIAPLARSIARAVVEARRRRTPCAASHVVAADVPRSSRDAACSRLLRRGWAKHATDQDDETLLELPYQAILDAGSNELRRLIGDPDFFAAARNAKGNLAACTTTRPAAFMLDNTLAGGTVALLLHRHAAGTLGLHKEEEDAVDAVPRRALPSLRPAARHADEWRHVLGDAVFNVPWYSPTSRACLDERIRAALRRAVFVTSLVRGRFTCRDLVQARRKSTPQLDELEVASLLFDLCDAQVLSVDRPPPKVRQCKPTIFDERQTRKEDVACESAKSLALAALADLDGPTAPRFCVAPLALDAFLALEQADALGPLP